MSLCGVRFERYGHVIWVDDREQPLAPGQPVVVRLQDQEALGWVVVGSGQLLENEPDVGPAGEIVRLATAADLQRLGRGPEPAALDASSRTLGAGLSPAGDTWLAPPGAPATVQDARTDAEIPSAAAFIARRFPG